MKKKIMFALIFLILIAALGVAGWFWFSLKFVYSSGERAGYVQKFSHKGWIIKTWEGELAMVNLPGTLPEIFSFTVRDEAVAEKIRSSMGNRIVINYHEHKFLPGHLFGDTRYFVVEVRPVDAAPVPPGLPATK